MAVTSLGHTLSRTSARPRVLITEGDNVGVIAMVRGLDKAGYDPWVAAVRRNAPAARSNAVAGVATIPDPALSSSAFARGVADLASVIEPVAILPGGEKGMLALAEQADELSLERATLAVCDQETVFRATDKLKLAEFAAQAGLLVPPMYRITAEDAARKPLPAALPAVIKPARSEVPANGGFRACAVTLAESREQVVKALRGLPDGQGLMQPYRSGRLSALAGVFHEDQIVAAVHQQAVRTWPANCGQMAFAVAVPRDRAFEEQIARLLGGLRWKGLFQLQFIETEEGRLLIDLNPRVYGSLSLALAAGVNLPAIWVDVIRGMPVSCPEYHSGVSFRNEMLDTFALMYQARRTSLATVARQFAVRASAHAFFAAGDPMPLLALGPAALAKLRARKRLRVDVHG